MYDDEKWAAELFGQAELGDERRSRRAQPLALSMLRDPGKSIPEQTRTWGGTKAAYRLLNSSDVSRQALLQPHVAHTREVCASEPVVLFVQDTTELDFTHMEHAQGYGPIGNHQGHGLLAHSLLALAPAGDVLGLAAQQCWARPNGPTRRGTETSVQRKKRPGLESGVWLETLRAAGPVPEGCRWISIGDRGSDSFDDWLGAGKLGWQCLSRLFVDRRTGKTSKWLTDARRLPAGGQIVVPQRARPGQAARTLHLNVAWQTVEVLAPRNAPGHRHTPPLPASVVRCWDDQYGLEWLLLATWPVTCFDEAAQCVHWYEQRWSIEEFHKCLKTGCRIERSQLKQAQAVQTLLGFASIVATRLLELTRRVRRQPEQPAREYIDKDYLTVLCARQGLAAQTLTVHGYWREVARLGGFLARRSDADPGWQTLSRGLLRLEVLCSDRHAEQALQLHLDGNHIRIADSLRRGRLGAGSCRLVAVARAMRVLSVFISCVHGWTIRVLPLGAADSAPTLPAPFRAPLAPCWRLL